MIIIYIIICIIIWTFRFFSNIFQIFTHLGLVNNTFGLDMFYKTLENSFRYLFLHCGLGTSQFSVRVQFQIQVNDFMFSPN